MNNTLSALLLFFCFSTIFTIHGSEKEKDKPKQTSTQKSSIQLSYPWQKKNGVWEYNSGSTQYYENSIHSQQLAKIITATSSISTR